MTLSKFLIPIFLTFSINADLPEPYSLLEEVLPFDSHGWYGHAAGMERLFKDYQIKTVVEVGSWLGASTRHFASLLPSGGKVYAVDHWMGSTEHQLGASHWHSALPHLYDQFLSNVIHAQLTDIIVPVRMSSLEAATTLTDLSVDLVYIDASHDTPSVLSDLYAWYPYVKGHGILCGDDWGYPGVNNAVQTFAYENGLNIDLSYGFWRLIEVEHPEPLPLKFKGTAEPYCSLERIFPFDPHGWYFNGNQIEQIFKTRKIQNVLEVGSWLGASTRHFASLIPPEGKVYAVDHWKGSAEHQPGEAHWCKQVSYLYDQFLSNVILSNLTDRIVPIRMSSQEAANSLQDLSIDLVYIDGSHDTQSLLADLHAWYPHVKGHGVLCGATWGYYEVQNAVTQFAREKNLTVKASNDFWELRDYHQPLPIQFSISESKIVKEIPEKTEAFASIIPGVVSTYVYTKESDYYADYQRSYFAITSKKAGWDCMRHYEILANGCIPYFVDIDSCHPKDLSFLPKELIKEAMHLEGVSFLQINPSVFNKNRYFEILNQLLEYTRAHLTCKARANALLKTVGFSGNGSILFLSGGPAEDYLRDSVLIGLKETFPEQIVDVPKISFIYKNYPDDGISSLYGKGFSYTRIVDDVSVNRENLEQRIREKEFELIVFGNVHRGLPYKDLIDQVYEQERVVYLCGEDCHRCEYVGWPNLFLREFSGNLESCGSL